MMHTHQNKKAQGKKDDADKDLKLMKIQIAEEQNTEFQESLRMASKKAPIIVNKFEQQERM